MTKVSFYTITPAKLARIAPYLTLRAALAHNATTDKWLYVVDNILDPAEVVTTPALVEYLETVLECMVAQNAHKVMPSGVSVRSMGSKCPKCGATEHKGPCLMRTLG